MQTTSTVLMIRPVRFGFNAETAVNNSFQVAGEQQHVQEQALIEFDALVKVLKDSGITVFTVTDSAEPHTPDSIFPNNWISLHNDGTVVLYPMFAANRRLERKPAVMDVIREHFSIKKIIDYTAFEEQERFLEGTGSMVLDRDKKIAYTCLSPRTDDFLVKQFCRELGYHSVIFTAIDRDGGLIYHTNVMMCVGNSFVLACTESIANKAEREKFELTVSNSGKKLIRISRAQMEQFAGNMLELRTSNDRPVLVMSTRAYQCLEQQQLNELSEFAQLTHVPLTTIETNGGGSARCMIAEIHLAPLSTVIR